MIKEKLTEKVKINDKHIYYAMVDAINEKYHYLCKDNEIPVILLDTILTLCIDGNKTSISFDDLKHCINLEKIELYYVNGIKETEVLSELKKLESIVIVFSDIQNQDLDFKLYQTLDQLILYSLPNITNIPESLLKYIKNYTHVVINYTPINTKTIFYLSNICECLVTNVINMEKEVTYGYQRTDFNNTCRDVKYEFGKEIIYCDEDDLSVYSKGLPFCILPENTKMYYNIQSSNLHYFIPTGKVLYDSGKCVTNSGILMPLNTPIVTINEIAKQYQHKEK